jgi:hypothetical protein
MTGICLPVPAAQPAGLVGGPGTSRSPRAVPARTGPNTFDAFDIESVRAADYREPCLGIAPSPFGGAGLHWPPRVLGAVRAGVMAPHDELAAKSVPPLRLPMRILFGALIPCTLHAAGSAALCAAYWDKVTGRPASLEISLVAVVVSAAIGALCLVVTAVISLFPWRSRWRLLITGLFVAALGLAPRVQTLLQ